MTEAGVTPVDAYLAASVVLGLVLNAVFGWWGDPIAALVIVYYGFEEGLYAWRGVMPKKQLPQFVSPMQASSGEELQLGTHFRKLAACHLPELIHFLFLNLHVLLSLLFLQLTLGSIRCPCESIQRLKEFGRLTGEKPLVCEESNNGKRTCVLYEGRSND
jgi:hypothetical protein